MSEEFLKVQKAMIIGMTSLGTLNPLKSLICQFNPKDFRISERLKWVKTNTIGSDTPDVTFAGGEAQNMTMNLLFDSTDTGLDVRLHYLTLLAIAAVDDTLRNPWSRKSEPARCKFLWGKLLSFDAVIEQISQRFTLFKPDGTPLRAEVEVTFSQVRNVIKPQNPTSRSEPRKTRVVREGERLDWIAYQEYGDPAHWRHIADSNGLLNPQDLRPGQVLQLVPLP